MTIILANGSFPRSPALRGMLRNAPRVICCDGAGIKLRRLLGRTPDAVVGDLDSIGKTSAGRLSCPVIHETEQETNDLCKAFRYCLSQGWRELTILGATGGREDHTLGNISLLPDFARRADAVVMKTDHGTFIPLLKSGVIRTTPGTQVSVFAPDANTAISSRGLKWELRDMTPRAWWQATLNEATSDTVSLDFTAGKALIVFLCEN